MIKPIGRKEFIKKLSLLAGGLLVFPRMLTAAIKPDPVQPDSIIDMHCHPSLKMYLWGKRLWKRHWLHNPGENTFHQQEDVHGFDSGNVRGVIASHYLTEAGIETKWSLTKWLWPRLTLLWFSEATKIEHQDYSNFAQINMMIDMLENQLSVSNHKAKKIKYLVARNYDEFAKAVHHREIIPFVHAIEGAHALGRNFVRSPDKIKQKQEILHKTPSLTHLNPTKAAVLPGEGKMEPDPLKPSFEYIRNLEALAQRGVCMMTLSHFFENDISWPTEGISPKRKEFPGFHWCYDPATDDKDLKEPVGVDVVRRMLEIGMVVDLTHMTPKARQHVFKIRDEVNAIRAANGQHPRPMVFSHVGSREVFDRHDNGMYVNYGFYDVAAEEVKQISCAGGVVGIIPEIFFLAGSNRAPQIPGQQAQHPSRGIPYIIETFKAINQYTLTKEYDNVGIGTDFDGLADNPKDLYLDGQLSSLVRAMRADPELNQKDYIEKILWGNMLRVLRFGWGERTIPKNEWPVCH